MPQTSVKPISPSAFAHKVDLPPAPHVRKIFCARSASAGSRRGSSVFAWRNVLAMSPHLAEMGEAFARDLLRPRREVEGLDREPARVLGLRERVAHRLELERAHA